MLNVKIGVMDLREKRSNVHDNNDNSVEVVLFDDGINSDIDIDAITRRDNDLTFQESRLVVTDVNGVPRVTSYNNLVNIDLTFSGEIRSLDNSNEVIVTNTNTNTDNTNNTSNGQHKQSSTDISHLTENDSDLDDDSQSFDCTKFFLILHSLSSQRNNDLKNPQSLSKYKIKKLDIEEFTILKKENYSDLKRLQENFNNWTNKIRNLDLLNMDPEEWGIELTDMVGDTSTTAEEGTDFDRLKTVDVWQQVSHYIKSKISI